MKTGLVAAICALIVAAFMVAAWRYLAYDAVTFGGKVVP